MNNLSRKLAEMIYSPSTEKRLLHPLINLQYYALHSTTTRQKNPRKQDETTDPADSKLASVRSTSGPSPPAAAATGSSAISDHHEWSKLAQRDAKPSADSPRPSEIPWQAKVVNSVNLIGSVAIPVQFQESPDGKYWAGTILSQEKTHNCASIWIPLIFEGDLAHAAACHLKEKDLVHIAGHLIGDAPTFNVEPRQSSIQVMVDSLSFVQEPHRRKESHTSYKQDEQTSNISDNAEMNGSSPENSWKDLVGNPNQWWDNRKAKLLGSISPKYPDFRHKDSRRGLWIDTAPEWALLKLEKLEFDSTSKTSQGKESKNKKDEQSWKDLVDNPKNWWDNRSDKRNARAPDFKHKNTGEGLWLNSSPVWVQDLLPPVKSVDTAFMGKDAMLS